jgi:hypothetical protein
MYVRAYVRAFEGFLAVIILYIACQREDTVILRHISIFPTTSGFVL